MKNTFKKLLTVLLSLMMTFSAVILPAQVSAYETVSGSYNYLWNYIFYHSDNIVGLKGLYRKSSVDFDKFNTCYTIISNDDKNKAIVFSSYYTNLLSGITSGCTMHLQKSATSYKISIADERGADDLYTSTVLINPRYYSKDITFTLSHNEQIETNEDKQALFNRILSHSLDEWNRIIVNRLSVSLANYGFENLGYILYPNLGKDTNTCLHKNCNHLTEAGTCVKKGYEYDYCTECFKEINVVETSYGDHFYGGWKISEAPTCTEKGKEENRCFYCNLLKETRDVNPTGHTPGDWKTTVEPTRTTKGEESRFCTVCKEKLETREIAELNDLISVYMIPTHIISYKSTYKLNPVIKAKADDYTVEFLSSNEKIATVENDGTVHGVSRGIVNITCTVTDKYGNTLSDTTELNVTYTWWQWLIIILFFGWTWY